MTRRLELTFTAPAMFVAIGADRWWAVSPAPARAASKLKIVTATTDLAEFAAEVGGDRVEVESIARGYQDPHFVEAKPSFLLKLRRADLLIVVGLQLEIGWLPPLITQCGNPDVQVGAKGYLDASQFAEILEIPTTRRDARHGRRPPVWEPSLLARPGKRPPDRPRHRNRSWPRCSRRMPPTFEERFQAFSKRLDEAEKVWDAEMKPFRGRKVVTYHRSWPNFTKRFGLVWWAKSSRVRAFPPAPATPLN